MAWSWSNIDWSATALMAVEAPVFGLGLVAMVGPPKARAAIADWARSQGVRKIAAGAFCFFAFVLWMVALHDKEGWFGEATAAWAQGIGSVVAIGAAIWIDRSAARRLAEQQADARQREDEARARQRADDRQALVRDWQTAAALIGLARDLLRNGAAGMSAYRTPELVALAARAMRDQLKACDQRFLTYPVELLRNPALASMFAASQLQVAMAVAYSEDIGSRDTRTFPANPSDEFATQLDVFRSNLNTLHEQFVGVMNREAAA